MALTVLFYVQCRAVNPLRGLPSDFLVLAGLLLELYVEELLAVMIVRSI